MSKMESRVSYLESHLSANLDNLDAVSVQLTVIQDFLQKQFGSRFVDYAVSRGVYIEKPQKSKSYYANAKTSSSLTSGSGSQGQDYGISLEDEYADEAQMEDASDPMTFVQIVDDSEEKIEEEYDDGYEYYSEAGVKYENEEYGAEEYGNEDYYEDEQIGQGGEEVDTVDNASSGPVIVNCVSEKRKDTNPTIKLPTSPPPITARPPPSRTYVKPNSNATQPPNLPAETQPTKQRLPSNFLASRKRPAAVTSSSSSAGDMGSLPKMPLLHPQVTQPSTSFEPPKDSQDYDEMLDFSSLTDVAAVGGAAQDGLMSLLDMKMEKMDPEGNDDLREYYNVLPDKSVQCKICDKILKAGWHKYGRHYRTHTGEKPFSCQYCGENFARKDNMNNHVKSKHENPRQRPNSNENVTLIDTEEFSPMYYLSSELC